MKKTSLILTVMAIGFLSGCGTTALTTTSNLNTNQSVNTTNVNTALTADRQAAITSLVQQWLVTKDDNLIGQIQNEQELQFAEQLLQQQDGSTTTSATDSK